MTLADQQRLGVCHCGCGQKTGIPEHNNRSKGDVIGVPKKYCKGHHGRGEYVHSGYRMVLVPYPAGGRGPRHIRGRHIREHIVVVQAVLGHPLPRGAVVHHIDGNGLNNRRNNLVACQDNTYHHLLHWRQRALEACGHADWLKCVYCKKYDEPGNIRQTGGKKYHASCNRIYMRQFSKRRTP